MPDLNDVYRRYVTANPPNYTDHMLQHISYYIKPFKLTEITIWLEPNFLSARTDICIEARNLPGMMFVYGFSSYDFMDGGQDAIAQQVARHYGEWLKSLYIPPSDNHELGEN